MLTAATALDKSTMGSIRNMQHRDAQGNIIGAVQHYFRRRSDAELLPDDPDQSNPTRARLERPLDTIRSFEAAIDGSYNRRSSYIRAGMEIGAYQCRQ